MKKSKPKWFSAEQRSKKEYPLMPAVLTLYRITNSKSFTKATGVKYSNFLLDFGSKEIRNYIREDQWEKVCNQCYQKVRKSPDFQKKLVREFQKRVPIFLEFCEKIFKGLNNE